MICCVMPGLLAGLLPPRGSRVMSVVMMGGGSVGLARMLLRFGFSVVTREFYDAAFQSADVCVVDGDCLDALARIRGVVPVVALVRGAKAEARAWAWGCGEVLRAPWSAGVLGLRIRRLLARGDVQQQNLGVGIALGDPNFRRVIIAAGEVSLSKREWALLRLLLLVPGVTVARGEILAQVWGAEFVGTVRVVDLGVCRVRRKLGPVAARFIQAVPGVGYRYVVAPY